METWKPVTDWPGYWISDMGGVRNKKRILKGSRIAKKYRSITLCKPGARRVVAIHVLVLEEFVGAKPTPLHEGLHWDDDPENNALTNLRWGTHSENLHDLVRNGKHAMANKVRCDHGHEFTPENTVVRPNGGRWCRQCGRDRARAYRRKPAVHAARMEKQRQRRAAARA